jgi:hypothetical protein
MVLEGERRPYQTCDLHVPLSALPTFRKAKKNRRGTSLQGSGLMGCTDSREEPPLLRPQPGPCSLPSSTLGWSRRPSQSSTRPCPGRVHLPLQGGACRLDARGAHDHTPTEAAKPRRPAAQTEPGAAGMVQLLPSRRVVEDLRLCGRFSWWRVVGWLRKRHAGLNWGTLHRRFLPGWEVRDGGVEMFRPRAVAIVRYRYRGTRIPTPWASQAPGSPAPAA